MSQQDRIKEAWKALREFYPGLSPDAEVWGRPHGAGLAANDDKERPGPGSSAGDPGTGANFAQTDDALGMEPVMESVMELVVQDAVVHPGWRYYQVRIAPDESEVLDEKPVDAGNWVESGYSRLEVQLEPIELVECIANHLVLGSRLAPSPRFTALMDRLLTLCELATAAHDNGSLNDAFPEDEDASDWLESVQDQVDRLAERG